MNAIKIKYLDPDMPKLEFIDGKSDWIDLRAAEEYHLNTGDWKLINLGVCIKLPEGYEAHIAPRSSTFKNYGIIQTNSVGIIDESYCGEDDVWKLPILAMKGAVIHKYDRICQFRIVEKMKDISFEEVDHMEDTSRGGFGSSGVK